MLHVFVGTHLRSDLAFRAFICSGVRVGVRVRVRVRVGVRVGVRQG